MSQPSTIVGLFQQQVSEQGGAPALLERRGTTWLSTSWGEWNERSRAIAAALMKEGIAPGDYVAIFSYSRREWVEADIGVLMAGAATATLYQNLAGETAQFILNDCSARVLFVEGPMQLEILFSSGDLPEGISRIVYFTDRQTRNPRLSGGRTGEVLLANVVPEKHRPLLISLEDFVQQGRELQRESDQQLDARIAAVTSDSVAKVVYTSGTTGMPKGSLLTHGNFLFVVESVEKGVGLRPDDTSLLFLPLAHVYAQLTYHAALKVGFKTAFAGSMLTVLDDAAAVKPTFFTSVPRLFEKIHAGVLRQVQMAGGLKARIFQWASDVGSQVSQARQEGRPIGRKLALELKLADKLVFSKLKNRLGGRVRFMVSGGAPLPRHLCEFFHAAGLLIIEGYGMTENASLTHYNPAARVKFGTVGPAIPGLEQRIADDGEILVRGPNVMKGYLGQDEITAETIDAEDWLHTGDVGTVDDEGYLTITDRKKEIIVTSGGKNIAPAPIENLLRESRFVSQAVVVGNGRKFLSVLLTLDAEYLELWAQENAVAFHKVADVVANPLLVEAVEQEIERVNGALDPFSTIKKFHLLPEEFSIQSGELTPSLKLKRSVIEEHCCEQIRQLYPEESGEC